MNKFKKIQAILIGLEILSVILLFMFGMMFYANQKVLVNASSYEPEKLIIKSFENSSANETKNDLGFALGSIKGELKTCPVEINRINLGDTITVWNLPGNQLLIPRNFNQTVFDKRKYQIQNVLIILFVFIPTIIIWVSERLVTKKIRTIKSGIE